MSPRWVDAHCHLQLEIGEARFSPADADAQVQRAREAGFECIVCVGPGLEPSSQAVDLAAHYDDVYATVGLHPHDASVQLPEEYIGHVMVFRTFEHVSYGLIMDGIKPVHIGDKLYEPDHK